MKQFLLLLAAISVFSFYTSQAQTKPEYEQRVWQDSTGMMYWNKNLPVYIHLSTEKDGKKYNLESEKMPEYDNPFYFDTEGPNFIRTRWAVDKESRDAVLPKRELLWKVQADSRAPHTNIKYSANSAYRKGGIKLYGKGTEISFSSKDQISGIQAINYSINGKAYALYDKPLSLSEAGKYIVRYFAVDNVGNSEEIKIDSFLIDNLSPETLCIITGVKLAKENIVSKSSKLHLEFEDNQVGVKESYYAIDDTVFKKYNRKYIPISGLADGKHTVYFYSVDNVGNKEEIQEYSFYLDKTAPITTGDVMGDRYVINGQTYFSGRTTMKLTAVDNKSGVKDIYYSVNGSKFKKYGDPFSLPKKAGMHIVKYFAVDNVENITTDPLNMHSKYMEYRHKIEQIYMDLLGPVLSYSIEGPKFRERDTLFISPKTKISFSAKDTESGLQKITYITDSKGDETVYSEPFTLHKHSGGYHRIEFFGYDNVNNRNYKAFDIILDKKEPEISYKFSVVSAGKKENLEVYPAYSKMYISAQDDRTGIKQIYYRLNERPEQPYNNFVKGFKKASVNIIKIRVLDILDNESFKEIKFYAD